MAQTRPKTDLASNAVSSPPPPSPLPGREAEFAVITNYVVDRIESRRVDVLFISGACGCGKTSTVARAEAWLKLLPKTAKALKDALTSQEDNFPNNTIALPGRFANPCELHIAQSKPTVVVNLKWSYINCSGLTRDGAMDAIWEAVSCDAAFADVLIRHIREMYTTMCAPSGIGNHAISANVPSGLNQTVKGNSVDAFFRKYDPFSTSERKHQRLPQCKVFKGRVLPFFAFVLDEAEFSDASSYPLFAAFASAAQEFGNRMSLILVSNARSLSFLPLNIAARRAVTELVFEGYSVEKLKQACRVHFAEIFSREGRTVEERETEHAAHAPKGGAPVTKSRPLLLDDVLAPSALDYAVKTAVSLHAADLRKAIALCGNAINAARSVHSAESGATTKGNEAKATKRPRDDHHCPEVEASTRSAPLTPKISLQSMLSSISDVNSALDQIKTFPPYTRQLLKCFVECVKRTNGATYSFMPATLQAELWKKADELRIPKPSAASVIEALEDLRGMGFVASSATSTRSQKLYTLAWSLAELEPKMSSFAGFL